MKTRIEKQDGIFVLILNSTGEEVEVYRTEEEAQQGQLEADEFF